MDRLRERWASRWGHTLGLPCSSVTYVHNSPSRTESQSPLNLFRFNFVSVCLGCYNKISQTKWIINNRSSFLTVLESGSPRSRQMQCLVRAHFLVRGRPSSHCGRRDERALWGLFYKGPLNPIHDLTTESPTEGKLPNTFTLGVRISTHTFCGDVNIQFNAMVLISLSSILTVLQASRWQRCQEGIWH